MNKIFLSTLCIATLGGTSTLAQTTTAENGIDNASAWLGRPVPEVYSAELSEFVFAAGVKLLAENPPDVMYLSQEFVEDFALGLLKQTNLERAIDRFDRAARVQHLAVGATVTLTTPASAQYPGNGPATLSTRLPKKKNVNMLKKR